MKKYIVLFAAILFSALCHTAVAQNKIREGKIKFLMTYPDSAMPQLMQMMMPTEMAVYFKNGNVRSEMKMGKGNMVMIREANAGYYYALAEINGSKIAMKNSKDYLNQLKDTFEMKKPEVTFTGETKNIADFKCKQAIVSMMFKGEKKSYEVWYTDDIDNIDLGEYKVQGINGFIMEMTMKEKGMTVHILCTSIDQMAVPDSYFKVPDDYKIMSMEDMMKSKPGK